MMIVDFRGRPPTKEYLGFFLQERTKYINYRLGAKEVSKAFIEGSLDLFFQEMEEAGITKTLALGRNCPPVIPGANSAIPNDHIKDLVDKYPDKIIGMAGIDPGNIVHDALPEIDRSIKKLGLKGIHIEPARSLVSYPNDKRLYPIYEKCVELDIPVVLMTGPYAGPNIEFTNPLHIEDVCKDFPKLNVIAGHGCWPWVNEVVGVAFKYPNFYIVPDCYMFMPGASIYIEAANSFLADQMIFGTAYPYRPLKQTVDEFMALPIKDEAKEKMLYKNALRLLKMQG